jgi:probable HAF family extracellular repeat protein
MKTKRIAASAILFILPLILLTSAQVFAFFDGPYLILGKLDESDTLVWAADINERNQVAGSSGDGIHQSAFRWSEKDGMEELGSLGGSYTVSSAINNRGEVAGTSEDAAGNERAFLWTESDGMIDLGTLGGDTSFAYDINERGQVAGRSLNENGNARAFIWDRRGGMRDIDTLGGDESWALAINARGQIAGYSCTGGEFTHPSRGPCTEGDRHAFLWSEKTGMVDLGVPGAQSDGLGINDRGDVVGQYCPSGNAGPGGLCSGGDPYRAVLWRSDGSTEDLGSLNDTWSFAFDINNRGQVFGSSNSGLEPLNSRAFVWSEGAGMSALEEPPGIGFSTALNSNNRGVASGYVRLESGDHVAVLWRTK